MTPRSKGILILLASLLVLPSVFALVPFPSVEAAPSPAVYGSSAHEAAYASPSVQTIPAPNAQGAVKVTLPGSYYQALPNSWNYTLKFRPSGAVHFFAPNGNITIPAPKIRVGGVKYAFPTPAMSQNSTVLCYAFSLSSPPANLNECFRFSYAKASTRYFSQSATITASGNIGTGTVFWRFSSNQNTTAYRQGTYNFTVGVGIDWGDMRAANPRWTSANYTLSVHESGPFVIDPSTVGTSTSAAATQYDRSGRVCNAATLDWVFYWDGTSHGFRTSSDGTTWSAESTFTTSSTGDPTSMAFTCSGTTLLYAGGGTTAGRKGMYVRAGTLTCSSCAGAGTISWSFNEANVTTTGGTTDKPSPAIDSSGNFWATIRTVQAGAKHFETFECTGTCGTNTNWVSSLDKSDGNDFAVLTALGSGAMSLVTACVNCKTSLTGYKFTSSWSTGTATSATTFKLFKGSCLGSAGNTFCAVDSGDGTSASVTQEKYTGSAWSEVVIDSTASMCDATNDCFATISGSGVNFVVAYTDGGADVFLKTSSDTGATYPAARATVSSSETSAVYLNAQFVSSTVYLAWTGGSASPFNVRFASSAPTFYATQPVKITMSAGVSGTWTLSGCSVSPTTVASDGAAHNLVATESCLITITRPADSAGIAYRINSMTNTSFTQTTPASGTGTERDITAYELLQQTFKITANAASVFDSGVTTNFKGTQFGVAGTTICSPAPASNASSTCSTGTNKSYADYNTQVTCDSTMGGAAVSTQWEVGGTSSFTQTTAQNTNTCAYYKQGSMTASYSIANALGVCSAPTLTYTSLGTAGTTYTLTTTGTAKFIDWASTPTITNALTGSTSSERCVTTFSMPAISAGGTINPAYKHQYLITVNNGLSYTYYNNGTLQSSATTNKFADATKAVTVTGQYQSSFNIGNPAFLYQEGSQGFQLWSNAALSGIGYVTNPNNLRYTGTASTNVTMFEAGAIQNSQGAASKFYSNGASQSFTWNPTTGFLVSGSVSCTTNCEIDFTPPSSGGGGGNPGPAPPPPAPSSGGGGGPTQPPPPANPCSPAQVYQNGQCVTPSSGIPPTTGSIANLATSYGIIVIAIIGIGGFRIYRDYADPRRLLAKSSKPSGRIKVGRGSRNPFRRSHRPKRGRGM